MVGKHPVNNNNMFKIFSYIICFCVFPVPPKLAPFAISDEPLHLGDYFQLTCAVVHGDFPYNITWYFNNEPITYVDGISILMHGKRSSSLNIDSVSGQHAGNYTCIGSNIAGSANVATTLSIRGLCTFTKIRSNQSNLSHSHTQIFLVFFHFFFNSSKNSMFILVGKKDLIIIICNMFC